MFFLADIIYANIASFILNFLCRRSHRLNPFIYKINVCGPIDITLIKIMQKLFDFGKTNLKDYQLKFCCGVNLCCFK